MPSIPGLPTPGSDVTILITRVHLHPLCVLVEFWGKFSQDRTADYERLAKDIQSSGNFFQEFEGNPGDQCLAQIDGSWFRSRIVSRNGSDYIVFLFDKGKTCSTTTNHLAWGKKEHFNLPPEVEFCVLANVLPVSVANKWSAMALGFLKSLSGKSTKAYVQDVIVQHRTFLLHIPYIAKQMYEMGLARKLSPDVFQSFVLMSLQSHGGAQVSPQTQISLAACDRLHKKELFLYPELPTGTVETVLVTEVTNPQRIFCQLNVFSQELKKLSKQITQCCEGRTTSCTVDPEMIGYPCAARGNDGKWYRSVLQQVCPTSNMVEVLHVDYGTKQFVQLQNVRPLATEFFRMPVVTYICSLHGVSDKSVGWTTSQIDHLRSLLLHKIVIAKFEYQSIAEGVHYVTLYGAENTNINSLFGSRQTEDENTLGDYAISRTSYSLKHPTVQGDEGYAVRLTDPKAKEERDVSTLMCGSGLAERTDVQRQSQSKLTTQPAVLPQLPDARLSGVFSHKGVCSEVAVNTVGAVGNGRRISAFKEHMFPIGSVLDVSVSYIESPNDFWCQLVQTAGHLKLLMHDMQAHYAGSEFQPFVEAACVARHPDNGMWYRALVIHKHETPEVDVLFIDYGQTETVSLYHLRRINPQFLMLHGQAFRCTLLNPVDPTSAINEWNEEAVEKFHRFVETAASDFVILKCTIYAVMYREQKILFNIVDLETPFESVCTSMLKVVNGAPPKKAAGTSFRMDTYYYSMHNVKTGTEEQVTVTCVNNVSQFYCQLERNAKVIKDLSVKVNKLCHQLENAKFPTIFGTLCFAKYTDGLWYRGQIKATKPAILVHFVDYGDTIEVEKSHLIPVPREANDIMSVPVQAVVCSLSDIPSNVPSEVNHWFETSATECKFRALIVAREPDGKLQVELYHGNTQLNSKVKKMFQIEMNREGVIHQGQSAPEAAASNAQKKPKMVPKQTAEMETRTQKIHKPVSVPKPAHQMKNADVNPKCLPPVRENGQKLRCAPLELYIPPHQRQSCKTPPSNTENGSEAKGFPTETEQLQKSKLPDPMSKCQNVEKLPQLADLPSQSITTGMEADVYVSHYNSPLSFYVQLVRKEDEIFSIVEKLNDPQFTPKTDTITDVHPGDLVQAEFEDDSSWYRAVVREIKGKTMALVEFVDFGNTAVTPISKLGKLKKSLVQLPMYSIHCALSGLAKEEVLDPEVVSAFRDGISDIGEKVLKCQFVRQSGSLWEVQLEYSGVNVTCKVPTRSSTDGSETASEEHEQVEEKPSLPSDIRAKPEISCSLCYRRQEFLEGHQLEVYITAINDAWSFWCQPADAQELDKITSNMSEVSDAAGHKAIDPSHLSPGSPCVALFSDDSFWYRAEVISKDGDELSVLFVDYGNRSQVNVADVKEISPDLMETPAQAFLCELEGFDASLGSWDSAAMDELSALTEEKVLQLTVTRITGTEGKMKCFVLLECEGLKINEALKAWWKCSSAEPEDQPEDPDGHDADAADACIDPQSELTADMLPSDDGADETIVSPLHNKDDHNTLSCDQSAAGNDTKEESFPVMDAAERDLTGAIDESSERQTSSTHISFDMSLSAEGADSEVTFIKEDSPSSMTAEMSDSLIGDSMPGEQTVTDHEGEDSDLLLDAAAGEPRVGTSSCDESEESCSVEEEEEEHQEELSYSVQEDEAVTGSIQEEELSCSLEEEATCLIREEELTACSVDEVEAGSVQEEEEPTCSAEEEEIPSCSPQEEVVTTCFLEVEEQTCSVKEEEVPSCSPEEEATTCTVEENEATSLQEEEEPSCSAEEAAVPSCSPEEEEVTTCFPEEEEPTFSAEEKEPSCSLEEETFCYVEEVEPSCSAEEVKSCFPEEVSCFLLEEDMTTCWVVKEEAVTSSVRGEEEELCFSPEEEEMTRSLEDEEEEVTCSLEDEEEEVTRSFEDEEEEVTRSLEDEEEEVTRSLEDEEEEVTRSLEDEEEEVTRSLEDEEEEMTRSLEDEEEEVTRSLEDEEEEVTCSLEDEEEVTRSFEEEVDEVTRSFEEEVDEVTRSLEDEEEKEVTRSFEEEEEEVTRSLEEEEEEVTRSLEEEEVTRSLEEEKEEARSVCTGATEPCGDGDASSGPEERLSSSTEETTGDETSALQEEERFAPTEPQAFTVCSPDLNDLVEEVTCLVRDICLTEVCRGSRLDGQKPVAHEEAEGEQMEQPVPPPPTPEEGLSINALEEQASSSANDSFEAQLSKVIHLSLIINDIDLCEQQQQPEE